MNPNDKKNLLDLTRVLLPNNQIALNRVKQAIEQSTGEVRYEGFWEDCNWWVNEITDDPFENGWKALEEELYNNSLIIELTEGGFAEDIAEEFHDYLNDQPSGSGWNWTPTECPCWDWTPGKGFHSERWEWIKTDGWENERLEDLLLEIQRRFIKPGKLLVSVDSTAYKLCLVDADSFKEIKIRAIGTPFGQITSLEKL